MRIWGPLPLVGIAKGADALVVEFHARGRDDQTSRYSLEPLFRDRLDPQRGTVGSDLHCTGAQPQPIAEYLGDNQPSCLINGCAHAKRIPLSGRLVVRPVACCPDRHDSAEPRSATVPATLRPTGRPGPE